MRFQDGKPPEDENRKGVPTPQVESREALTFGRARHAAPARLFFFPLLAPPEATHQHRERHPDRAPARCRFRSRWWAPHATRTPGAVFPPVSGPPRPPWVAVRLV